MDSRLTGGPELERDLRCHALGSGPLFQFRDLRKANMPAVAAGVYTVWRGPELVYVGMAGSGLLREMIAHHRGITKLPTGLFSRLLSHASGRRSGDQFCVYVADRFVLPGLSREDIAEIGNGNLSLDGLVRDFICDHLAYRYVECADGQEASALEREVRSGLLGRKPLLNPLR